MMVSLLIIIPIYYSIITLMAKDKRLSSHFKYSNKFIYIGAIILTIYGFFMIISAEMGESSGDLNTITNSSLRLIIYMIIGFLSMIILSLDKFAALFRKFFKIAYIVVLFLLLITRAFGAVGGAYAWIRLGPISFQPSEFAKIVIIVVASKLFSETSSKDPKRNFWTFVIYSLIYVVIVAFYQHDFGTALVIAAISFACALVSPNKRIRYLQNRMLIILFAGIIIFGFLISPIGTKLLENFSSSYQINRFLASANPFAYEYDSGYHLIMSLISFATGGIFGVGYGQSIHKYMNFPNPSTDFILPVIIEEMGIAFGLVPIVLCYGFIIGPLIFYSYKSNNTSDKIIVLGTFMYFVCHIILNIGGVTGLIPLTGVPLLLLSSGGTSLISCLACLGLSQYSIINYKRNKDKENEDSSR